MNAQIGIDCSTRVNTVPISRSKSNNCGSTKRKKSNNCNLHF